jgi:murein L,D-transpeptidase YcbB/YkuD
MRFISDLRVGRMDPQRLGFHLDVEPKRRDLDGLLRRLSRAADPIPLLESIEPPFRRYRTLLEALARYRALNGDPRLVEPLAVPEKSVRPGDTYPDLARLVYRLERFGDLAPDPGRVLQDGLYTDELSTAVRRFQVRHGLARDGILGRETLAALNLGMEQRVRQIRLTLERWRWLPDDLGHRPVVINVPEFRLYAFEDDGAGGYRLALDMDVIVGKAYRRHQTPLFRGAMQYIVFAPYWNVPYGIQRRELYPEILKDPGYLQAHGLEIVPDYRPDAQPLPATEERIALLKTGQLKLRQPPGPDNALGVAKFIFPNDHSVYLHGTPATGLFYKYRRDFSHGCIRVADPPRLAAHVLSQEPGWDRARVDQLVASGERRTVNLSKALDVFVLYGTAVADPDGTVRFFRDIYRHDQRLADALAARWEAVAMHERATARGRGPAGSL